MFERWTERARQVIVLAKDEGHKLPSDHIGTEHILLGLITEGEGIAARVLADFGIDADALRYTLPPSHKTLEEGEQLPFTPRAKKVMELALREALGMGHNYVGTEHLLMAVARDPGDIVRKFLIAELGETYSELLRLETMELLRGPRPSRGEVDLNEEERRELKLKDVLADVMTGYNMWKEAKQMNAEEWTDADEAFSRWIDGAGVSEFL